PILDSNGVQIVLSGHEHSYQRSVPMRKSAIVSPNAGTNYVTSGGGGAILYSVPNKPIVAFGQSAYHYLPVEVSGSKITIHSCRPHRSTPNCPSRLTAISPCVSQRQTASSKNRCKVFRRVAARPCGNGLAAPSLQNRI